MARRKYVKENNLVKAINTDSLELQKPLVNEFYDINVHNSNMDKIDLGYKQNKNDISNINYELSKTENTKYTTENGIKEFSCKDGYVDNVVIEGETLVNLYKRNMEYNLVNGANSTGGFNTGDNYEHLIVHNITGVETFVYSEHISQIQKDKEYTLIVDVKEITGGSFEFFHEGDWICGGSSAGLVKVKFTSKHNSPRLRIDANDLAWVKFKNIMILEGDHTDKPISYFEGLKSVGQGDKIEVLSYKTDDDMLIGMSYTEGLEDGSLQDLYKITEYIPVVKGDSFCSYDDGTFLLYNSSKTKIGYSNTKEYIVATDEIKFIRKIITKANLQYSFLLKNSKQDKKQISTTLRSLPNGVKDTIEKRGNKYVKIQRCGEVTLNGGESWINHFSINGTNTLVFASTVTRVNTEVETTKIVSDKFNAVKSNNFNLLDVECISNGKDNNYQLMVRINKTKLSAQTVDAFKTWLKSNPVTVVYELETPQIIELPNFNPQTFEDNTTLLLNTGAIQGECEFEVTNSVGSEIEVLKDKVSDLDDNYVSKYTLTPLNGWGMDNVEFIRDGRHIQINAILNTQGTLSKGTKIATFPYNLRPNITVISDLIDISGNTIGGIEIVNNFIQVNGAFDLKSTSHGCKMSFSYYI